MLVLGDSALPHNIIQCMQLKTNQIKEKKIQKYQKERTCVIYASGLWVCADVRVCNRVSVYVRESVWVYSVYSVWVYIVIELNLFIYMYILISLGYS